MELIQLDRSKVQAAAAPFARAFFDYPLFTCYHPSQTWRQRHFTAYCELGLRYALRNGEVYSTSDLNGTIIWFPPGKTHINSWLYLKEPLFFHQALLMGWKTLSRISSCEDYAALVHEQIMPGPHWYIWGLAVDPDCQGQGLGGTLMEPGLRRANQQGLPVYLETHDTNNIPYYQKHGFELLRSERVPSVDLPFWCLVRQPVPNAV